MNHRIKVLACAGLCAAGLVLAPREASAQELLQEIVPESGSYHKFFGDKLAFDADTLVMGDFNYILESSGCSQQQHGAVSVFKKINGSWQLAQNRFLYLDANDDAQQLGKSVAIKGNVIVAGAPGQRYVNGATNLTSAGALVVYKRPYATANFAYTAKLYSPSPQTNDRLGDEVDVTTNGVFAAATSLGNQTLIRVYRVDGTPVYNTTITFPGGGWPSALFITNQNVLVANCPFYDRPYAWKLTGSGATPVDTTSLSAYGESTVPAMTGDGDSIVWLTENVDTGHQTLRTVKFGSSTVLTSTITSQVLPPELEHADSNKLPITFEESKGIFFKNSGAYADIISAYKWYGGRYRYQGFLSGIGEVVSLAFNGTELLVGDRSQQPPTSTCEKLGAVWAYRPMAPTSPGPGLSTRLQPWMSQQYYANGRAVANIGSFAMSATSDTYQAASITGSVDLYQQDASGAWQQVEQYFDGQTSAWEGGFTQFGGALDLTSSFFVIGAPWGYSNVTGVQTGSVQFAQQSGGFPSGPYLPVLDPPSNAEWGQEFGISVALSGNRLFVGAPAPFSGPGSPVARGVVYRYEWNGWSWDLLQEIRGGWNGTDYERFGERVAASGDYLIVGIPNRASLDGDENPRPGAGAVQIFYRDPNTNWYTSVGEFAAPTELGNWAGYGETVSIGTDYAAAGSMNGTVGIYRRVNPTYWALDQVITPGISGFGYSVAIEGSRLVVGSPWEGRVHRYERYGWWYWMGSLTGATSSYGESVDLWNGVVSLGETYGTVGTSSNGSSYVTNFYDID